MSKVQYTQFKLSTITGRVGLLTGITAGTVTQEEVEQAVLVDTEKRPYRKPVVAYGRRFGSITAAAEFGCGRNASLNELKAEQARIRKMCNEDCWAGFYWSN